MMENDNNEFCIASKDVSSSSIGDTNTEVPQEKTLATPNAAEASLSVDDIGCDDSSAAEDVSSDTSPVKENAIASSFFREYHENEFAAHYQKSYPTPLLDEDLLHRSIYHKVIGEKTFSPPILGFGVHNFMSYAAHFCRYEAQNGAEIISVGCGDGTAESEIVATYRKHFAQEIKITLVDPNPDYRVDFKTVDDLIAERPHVVGNCILLIIWPEPSMENDGYDIDAVRKLRPLAALIATELTSVSGSEDFTAFLLGRKRKDASCYDSQSSQFLNSYVVDEVASQEVYMAAGKKFHPFDKEETIPPGVRIFSLSLMKLKRKQ